MNIISQDLGKPVVEKITIEMNGADYELYVGLLRRFVGGRPMYVKSTRRSDLAGNTLIALGEFR